MSQRLLWVDMVRALAIILMIIFHFCYDLRYFGYVDWHIPNGPNWWPFRYLILTLFIFTVGMSLQLAHGRQFYRRAFVKRLLQLGVAALAITIMSLVLFPRAWIYFGILHFIALASLLGLPFLNRSKLALVVGVLILCSYWLGLIDGRWPFDLFSNWLPEDTEDYVPLFPWLGVMLLGLGFAGAILPFTTVGLTTTAKPRHSKSKKRKRQGQQQSRLWDIKNTRFTRALAWMGRRGLTIYLIHQPIFFAGFYLLQWLKSV